MVEHCSSTGPGSSQSHRAMIVEAAIAEERKSIRKRSTKSGSTHHQVGLAPTLVAGAVAVVIVDHARKRRKTKSIRRARRAVLRD